MAEDSNKHAVVLGLEMARAREIEARHQAAERNPSPLRGAGYEPEHNEFSLLRVQPLPLDGELERLCRRFLAADDAERDAIRHTMSMHDFYTLIQFAKRCAVWSLRNETGGDWHNGCTALAMIDPDRVDRRDVIWAAGLLGYALWHRKCDPNAARTAALSVATGEVRELVAAGLRSKELSDWGYAAVAVDGVVGFVETRSELYKPSRPLTEIAIGIADHLNRSRYFGAKPQIATSIPPVWFPRGKSDKAKELLTSARATISVSANLRSAVCSNGGRSDAFHLGRRNGKPR